MPGEDCLERALAAADLVRVLRLREGDRKKSRCSLDSSAARFMRLLLAAPHGAAVAAAPAVAVTFVVILTLAALDEVSIHCIIPQLANCYLRVRSDTCFHLVIVAPFFLCWLLAICRVEKETATERNRTFCRVL